MRNFVAETRLHPANLVYPLFITDQVNDRTPVPSMPGIFQLSTDNALIEIGKAMETGVRAVLLFGVPSEKDQEATSAWFEQGVIGDDLLVVTDTCLCEYMSHGHCGYLMEGRVLNDPTLEILSRVAVSQAEAGADIIAPSDMMDGRVMFIRDSLDDAGYTDTPIMSYAAKYNSCLYSPFREAAASAPSSGDRKSYQMDYRNGREALEEVMLDLTEGADIIMVKPALGYLDVVSHVSRTVNVPVAAYSVSGEYSMIKAAAEKGWINEKEYVLEALTGIKRAGASIIVTYHAPEAVRWIREMG
jgi:porphobilinogen synthase